MDSAEIQQVAGAYLFTPDPHHDDRGFFSRTLDVRWLRDVGIDPAEFTQDSISRSARGVIRGMHLRQGRGESKLVRCSFGSVFDVIVDMRPTSPTYGNTFTVVLTDDPPITLYVPAGCAHGFQALTDPADVSYRIDRPHDPTEDVTIAWNDPDLSIAWPLTATRMSGRDREASSLQTVRASLSQS